MLTVGDIFPDFYLDWVNENNEMVKCTSDDLKGWAVIYFYPKDFTFICATEIAEMDLLVDENVFVMGVSGDNEFCKLNLKENNSLISNIKHPLAADCGLSLSDDLGIIAYQEGVCLRATFIVDPDRVIQHVSVNALDTGRNPQEALRILKALQAWGLTACNWSPGQELLG